MRYWSGSSMLCSLNTYDSSCVVIRPLWLISKRRNASCKLNVLWQNRADRASSIYLWERIKCFINLRNIKFSTWRSFSICSCLSCSSRTFCFSASIYFSRSALCWAASLSSSSRFCWRWAGVRLSAGAVFFRRAEDWTFSATWSSAGPYRSCSASSASSTRSFMASSSSRSSF